MIKAEDLLGAGVFIAFMFALLWAMPVMCVVMGGAPGTCGL